MVEQTTEQDNFTVNLGGYKPGIYVFKLYSGYMANISTEKIIIQ
jgi:hypothetical protein